VYAGVPYLVNDDLVAFLDEDNWHHPDFVQTMQFVMDTNPDIEVATCRRVAVTQDGEYLCHDNFESIGVNDLGYPLFDTNTYVFRTSAWRHYSGSIYEKWGGDRTLTQAVIERGKYIHIDQYLVFYRVRPKLYNFFSQNGHINKTQTIL
jgi:cellulose synthase/poly-beta-1,6-N-acetylglucosamine synthase-like glycosyltransferase